jgi:hypothetical protein
MSSDVILLKKTAMFPLQIKHKALPLTKTQKCSSVHFSLKKKSYIQSPLYFFKKGYTRRICLIQLSFL